MTAVARRTLTLAVHPTWAGFGWAAFESPFSPFDWGLVYTENDKNAQCLRKLEKLLDRLAPEILVVEACSPRDSARANRIYNLCRSMANLASTKQIDVAVHSRGDIQRCFAAVGAATRYEIAEAVARNLEALRHRLPRRRQAWEKEDPRLALFSASALALTHYSLSSSRLLDDLRDAA